MKRFLTVLTTTVVAVSLLSACGKNAESAQPAPSNQTQPGGSQGAAPADSKDPLAQFPALKLPFSVDPNTVIADYQGGKLTAKEFENFLRALNFLNPQQGAMIETADTEALKTYVREYAASKILSGRADAKVKKESNKQAETTFSRLKEQYMERLGKDEAKFTKLLEGQGVTKDEVVKQMELINNSIGVLQSGIDEAALKKEYDQTDKSVFTIASVRHILISSETRKPEEALKIANDLLARLKKGEDFATLAKEKTEDPGSKETGGLYENADVNGWVPEFKQAALTQPIGQISDPPVKTDYGYHIIKVEKRSVRPFEEVKDSLKQKGLGEAYDKFISQDVDKLVTNWNIPEAKPVK